MTNIVGPLTLLFAFAEVIMPKTGGDADEAKAAIAAQIRKQGFSCNKPVSAERDVQRSKPHEAVWVLRCGEIRYRVRLVPKTSADVERLE